MSSLRLRKARWTDCRRLWFWRNDQEVRHNSFSSAPVPYAQHQKWLAEKLAAPATFLWIGEQNGEPVGQVRMERRNRSKVELHLAVKRSLRGRGLGSQLLAAGCRAADRAGIRCIAAHVLVTNFASMKVFIQNDFCIKKNLTVSGKKTVYLERTHAKPPGSRNKKNV